MPTFQMLVRAMIPAASLLAISCAGQSGYNIDVRNNTSTPVVLDLRSEKKNEEAKVSESFHVAAGATTNHFTRLAAGSRVVLEAQVEGETTRPPAAMPVTLGQTRVDVIPQIERLANDPKAPRVRLREREGH
jgi:hypothetical protein